MSKLPMAAALILSAAAGFATVGAAMAPPALVADSADVIPAGGCHSSIRTHYVPEFGRSVRHYHRGRNCEPVAAGGREVDRDRTGDCHRDIRTHRVGGVMLRHRHVGSNCRIREAIRSGSSIPN